MYKNYKIINNKFNNKNIILKSKKKIFIYIFYLNNYKYL